jgi:hypothetical protein
MPLYTFLHKLLNVYWVRLQIEWDYKKNWGEGKGVLDCEIFSVVAYHILFWEILLERRKGRKEKESRRETKHEREVQSRAVLCV